MLSVLLPARPSLRFPTRLSLRTLSHTFTRINKMPRRAYLLAFASILQFSHSKIINGTVSDLLWPQMRSSIANYLIKNQISTGATAYKKVFQKIPDSGNCWCFSDKSVTVRGEPQDLYDAACKRFHYCLTCGYKSGMEDFDENTVIGFDMKERSDENNENITMTWDLVDLVESNNMLNFNAESNTIYTYDWECETTQTEVGMAVCKGFKQLETEFINAFLTEIDAEKNLYNTECKRSFGVSVGSPTTAPLTTLAEAEFFGLLQFVPHDSCCGVSPTWKSYNSHNGAISCCGSDTYNITVFECCEGEVSNPGVSEIGTCIPTTLPCDSSPCLNSGVCHNSDLRNSDFQNSVFRSSGYTCACQGFYAGLNCQLNLTPYRTSFETRVSGDPHYHTFDGYRIDPQGMCAYTATKLCTNETTVTVGNVIGSQIEKRLPFFDIIADQNWNVNGAGFPRVTYVHGVDVFYRTTENSDLYHFKIHKSIDSCKNIHLKINNGEWIKLRSFENFETEKIATRKQGRFHVIYLGVGFQSDDTQWLNNTATEIQDFVIKIKFRYKKLFVRASELLEDKICGMFGNWNGVNDVELPDGVDKREHELSLMNQFAVRSSDVGVDEYGSLYDFDFIDQEFDCFSPVEYPDCSESDTLKYQKVCEVLDSSPFEHCEVNKTSFIEECTFDLCQGMDETETLCDMFEMYVSNCNSDGASQNFVENWRGDSCKIECGENQFYDSCQKSACQISETYCEIDSSTCESSVECVEGCFCESGFLMDSDEKCVETPDSGVFDSEICTEGITIEQVIHESTLCFTCQKTRNNDKGQYGAFNGTECMIDDIYGDCKLFTTQSACETCSSVSDSKVNENTCQAEIYESWYTDLTTISAIYHSTDFSGAFYTENGVIIDEETFLWTHPNNGKVYDSFPNDPLNCIDGRITKYMAGTPPGYKETGEILVVTENPVLVNFCRIYPQYKPCGNSEDDISCRLGRYELTQIIVNGDVVCRTRENYNEARMEEVLRGCDHWLYFDCDEDVFAENFTLSNGALGDDLDGFTNLQVVEFQAGFQVVGDFEFQDLDYGRSESKNQEYGFDYYF